MSEFSHSVAVVGAGPAGLFAARELARSGARVFLFNRDVKPGGLAEYGIYPDKNSMKEGLRSQFRQALETPGLTYYGNIVVGAQGDLTLDDLRGFGFQAILVAAGAQGTKWLGLPGESLTGVYHAKDLVYHYNRLPPYSQKPFHFGKRVALVGAGNVMLDIARYLIHHVKVDEVIAVVRRGPAEVKFDKKEMEYVIANLDQTALDAEVARVTPQMQAIGQSPEAAKALILEALPKAYPVNSLTRFRFVFLASPTQILGEQTVSGLEIEDNSLALKAGEVKARGTGNKRVLDVDSVIFAIGDKVDDTFGLPVEWNEFVKNASPRFAVDGVSYETYDPAAATVIEDVFVAGWSRQASSGLVGYARKDGINGSKAVLQYLETLPPVNLDESGLEKKVFSLGKHIVTQTDLRKLAEIEREQAQKLGVEAFKFATNEEMFAAIGSVG
jgi:ferredoxin/flavodoxin---NADP+ reductase